MNFHSYLQHTDWLSITERQVLKRGGESFLLQYYTSLPHALKTLYPDLSWPEDRSKPPKPPRKVWISLRRQKEFVEKIGKELGVQQVQHFLTPSLPHIFFLLAQMSDWYYITRKALIEKGGRGLFNHHASLEDLLKMVYPGFPWEPTGFIEAGRTPIGHWKDPANLLQALTRAEQRIGILKALIPPPQHLTTTLTHIIGRR